MAVVILGFFAPVWFNWSLAERPDSWEIPLLAGVVLSVVVTIVGLLLAKRHWHGDSALHDPNAMSGYNRLLLIEVAAAVFGALLLIVAGKPGYIASWVALVVGAHFWPLSRLLQDTPYIALGAAPVVTALIGLGIAFVTSLADSTVVGAGTGTAMLLFAVNNAIATTRSSPGEHA
jgi:hypothetical protein